MQWIGGSGGALAAGAGEIVVNRKVCRLEGPSPACRQRVDKADHTIVQHAISLTKMAAGSVLSPKPSVDSIGAARLRAVAYARK